MPTAWPGRRREAQPRCAHRGRWYPRPMAPPMAAESLGPACPSVSTTSWRELRWPPGVDLGLVECAGGVASPQAADGDVVDLVERLAPDLALLVAGAGLGALTTCAWPPGRWPGTPWWSI